MKRKFFWLVSILISTTNLLNAQDFTYASEQSIHSVVYIQCQYKQQNQYYEDFFDNDFFSNFFGADPFSSMFGGRNNQRERIVHSSGSGVIITNNGYIITNNHVVSGADSILVTLNNRKQYVAKLIGLDANNDLAVIKIEAENLSPIKYGNSDSVKVGQWVLAVGNPFNLTSTVTAGIVSAKARNINILSRNDNSTTSLTSFIQTDAAMNPGNSGGALVNLQGELIGINAAIASNTGSYAGYSFAIPVNIAKKVADDIIKFGTTQRASAGLVCQEISTEFAKEHNINDNEGLYISEVIKGSCSEKAGLKAKDIILSINNHKVNTISELNEIMCQLSPNQTITFNIKRGDSKLDKQVVLMDKQKAEELESKSLGNDVLAYGIKLRELTQEEKNKYNLNNALIVTATEKGAIASQGIKKGFVITSIDGKTDLKLSDAKQLSQKKGQTTIEGFYPQNNRSYYFMLVL